MKRDTTRRRSMLLAGLRVSRVISLLAIAAGISACVATAPKAPDTTGAAVGSTAVGAYAQLQTCSEPVGTVRLQDGNNASYNGGGALASPGNNPLAILALLRELQSPGGVARAPEGSEGSVSLDSLRLLIQQSNCFLIVDRGVQAEASADDEKRRSRTSDEVRDGADMGPGQEVAAEYVLRSSVIDMGTKDSTSVGLGGLGGALGKVLGSASVGRSVTSASVMLVLSDVRTKVQVGAAQGKASSSNIALATNLLGKMGKGFGGMNVRTESKTSGTEILLQAFADAYNKMVPALQNYKSQQLRSGRAQEFSRFVSCKGQFTAEERTQEAHADFALRYNSRSALIQASNVLPVGERLAYVATPTNYSMTYLLRRQGTQVLVVPGWFQNTILVAHPNLNRLNQIRLSISRQTGQLEGKMLNETETVLASFMMQCESKSEQDAAAPKL